uniref:Telomere length regulation protein conserved domain-containing protein n=1 Tax=Globodera rostochiensis TaxID=31243 RepID=A0A914I5P8_GLORO
MLAKDDTLRNHSISAQCDRILTLIEAADSRTELLAVFDDLAKFQSVAEPGQTYSLTQAFLRKLTPPLFGHLTETDFKTFFTDVLFLRSAHPATSLWALICSLSQCDDGGSFKFAKCISLLAQVQQKLLQNALKNSHNSKVCHGLGASDVYQFAFVLSSFPSRVYNYFGDAKRFHLSFDRAAAIVADFEERLLDALLAMAKLQPTELNMPMFAHILAEYSAASGGKEFIQRFLSSTLCDSKANAVLKGIFAQNSATSFERAESRRNYEAMILIAVATAPDGQSLQVIFGDSVLSDANFRRLLVERAALMPSSAVERRPRNSEKVAECLALSAPSDLVTAFQTHVQLFVDRCKVVEMASLHSHFIHALAVVDFARRLGPDQRCAIRDELMYSLVPIVPQMIEIADCSKRQIGMLMAQTLFSLFNFPSPPQFDYFDADPMLSEFRVALQQKQQNDIKSNGKRDDRKEEINANLEKKREHKCCSAAADVRVAVLLDSDDDEGAEEGVPSLSDWPAYLRDCLEILSPAPGDQPVKMSHWVGALYAIPEMLRRRSVGWNTLGEDLLETIVALDNRYNVSEFAKLRAEILQLLLAQTPELVSNAFRLITSRRCPMSRRFLLISAVVDAAKLLANGENGQENGREKDTKPEKTKFDGKVMEIVGEQKGPKVIRRSTALQKQSRKCHENGFSRVAPQFVFPLLHFTQFDHLYGAAQSSVFLGKLALALGELITCAARSPSILCILSSAFEWLSLLRRIGSPHNLFVWQSCVGAYLSICDMPRPSSDLLREHFTDELSDCRDWLAEMATEFPHGDIRMDE